MTINIAINGFGRIGRTVLRRLIEVGDASLGVVAINAGYPAETLAHLLRYDSVHGRFRRDVRAEDGRLIVDGRTVRLLSERDPARLPWGDLGVDIVVEATGQFTHREGAARHLEAGARRVLITAPGKNEDVTIVIGVNADDYEPSRHFIVSGASCTTNALAPIVKVLHEAFGVRTGLITTVHAVTNDQKVLDNPHKDLRRARTSGMSIIPTTTGAAKAVGKVLPELAGRLRGMALRVPTPNVSVVDLVAELETEVTPEAVNDAFRQAETGALRGILGVSEAPLVSVDFNGDDRSAIVDAPSTIALGRMVKVLAWYDNEWGYSARIVDLLALMARMAQGFGADDRQAAREQPKEAEALR
ncbi:MAG: type I glyceraldehyde-3-phosphate dehydrogenase [Hydrogenibacillus sp.]|nr:type I glyceraldehyde-3-phosphate dehydrogenase [Hydrogenibacillus sp.]